MKRVLAITMLAGLSATSSADILYQQLPNPNGGSFVSSWWDPDGSNYDQYVWDAFTLSTTADIASIQWRGTYGASGPVSNFTVAIYASIAAGTQPDVSQLPLVEFATGGNAGQTYAGVYGGVAMYDHTFTLPVTFRARAGVKYWVQIEGWQSGFPDWGLAAGQGGEGSHFLCQHTNIARVCGGVPTGCWFTTRTGDTAFTLLGTVVTDVEDSSGSPRLALRGISPNPSQGDRLDVMFDLPNAAPATLDLFDVSGRRVNSVEVGSLGAGPHLVDLARPASLRTGIYFIRLTHHGQDVTMRVAIVR